MEPRDVVRESLGATVTAIKNRVFLKPTPRRNVVEKRDKDPEIHVDELSTAICVSFL